MPGRFPAGSIVRVVQPGSAPVKGKVVGCYAYEQPVFLVETDQGLIEAPLDWLETAWKPEGGLETLNQASQGRRIPTLDVLKLLRPA